MPKINNSCKNNTDGGAERLDPVNLAVDGHLFLPTVVALFEDLGSDASGMLEIVQRSNSDLHRRRARLYY